MPKRKNGLSDLQERFCKEYIVDFNATQAAIRSGYSKKNAQKIGPETLGKTRVQARIKELTRRKEKKLDISAEKTLKEIANLAYSNFYEILDKISKKKELTEDEQKIISEKTITKTNTGGSIKYKAHSKEKALEMLARYFNMFVDKLEVEGKLNFVDWIASKHKNEKSD